MIVYAWQEGETYLARDGDLLAVFESNRALVAFGVVKYNGYTGFGDACLTAFVYEVLLVLSAHLWQQSASSETERRIQKLYAPEPCL
jgi:hypothetical protein